MVPNFERPLVRDGEVPLPPVLLWPRRSYAAPTDSQASAGTGCADHPVHPHLPDARAREKKKGTAPDGNARPAKPKDQNAPASDRADCGNTPSPPDPPPADGRAAAALAEPARLSCADGRARRHRSYASTAQRRAMPGVCVRRSGSRRLLTAIFDRSMVRSRGLEPPRVAPLAPQASASTNSATTAWGVNAGMRCPRRRRRRM